MVDFITKRDGPRREDVAAKRFIAENSQKIRMLADQLSGGGYSARKAARNAAKNTGDQRQEPRSNGPVFHLLGGSAAGNAPPKPYIRVSVNNRVVMVDDASGKQMHHLGEVRRGQTGRRFVLATAANGFFAPVEADIAVQLADVDGKLLAEGYDEASLAAEIAGLLGLG